MANFKGGPGIRPESDHFRNDDVLASELATYAFCAKAWHLEHRLRRPVSSEASERRLEGITRHEQHGARLREVPRVAPRLVLWSVLLVVLAAVLVVIALLADRLG